MPCPQWDTLSNKASKAQPTPSSLNSMCTCMCACMCPWGCVYMQMCVCVCVRERERESACVMCVCVLRACSVMLMRGLAGTSSVNVMSYS